MSIVIGKSSGKNVTLDLDVLLRTRLLVQANSGGGKSWLLRRMAEQLFGKIPVLIIDPEGEFATLREKYSYVLVGKGGETPADPRSAALVAHKLLELRASAVCDLYEMKPSERHHWVRLFLEALIDAPKKLWRPTIIIVDEAHTFCPEKGAGESEASDAMTALPTRGRKRRFCAVWATQRLGKLRKDASAELLNRLIGPTFEDVDLKRAAELLSIRSEDRREFDKQMRVLEPGNFFALGRAITKERLLVHVGPVETSHEIEDAKYGAEAPPTPEKIKPLLPKLADLPKQAEEKARTEAELRSEIRSLKAQLKSAPVIKEVVNERGFSGAGDRAVRQIERKYAPIRTLLEEAMKVMVKVNALGFDDAAIKPEEISKALEATAKEISRLAKAGLQRRSAEFERLKRETNRLLASMRNVLQKENVIVNVDVKHNQPFTVRAAESAQKNSPHAFPLVVEHGDLSRPQIAILKAMSEAEAIGRESLGRAALAFFAGASPSSSGFEKNVSTLKMKGCVRYGVGSTVFLTDEGRKLIGSSSPIDTDQLFERVSDLLSTPQSKILQLLREVYPDSIARAEVAEGSGQSATSSGFDKNISTMSSRELLTYPQPGHVRCADWLFID